MNLQATASSPLDAVLHLRSDLVVSPDAADGEGWVIEDRLNAAFYRLGESEYHFVTLLDGKTTAADALARLKAANPTTEISDDEILRLCHWLVRMQLVQTPAGQSPASAKPTWQELLTQLNPFFIRVPLFQPDALLQRVEPFLRPLFSPIAVLFSLILIAVGLGCVIADWARFSSSMDGIFTPGKSVSLFACWLILKVIHEFGHGLVCKRYGGFVRDCGAMLILFFPVAYIDVTSSWRFQSKWHRIFTAAAGMYFELTFAAVAAIAWSVTEDGVTSQWLANAILMASISTILFNANPLMRFDGYYILSDIFGMTNLYTRGAEYLQYVWQRWFFGVQVADPSAGVAKSNVIRVYAVASWMWRVVLVGGLMIGATSMFHGVGLLLAAFGAVVWLAIPAYKLVRYLIVGDGVNAPKRLRFCCTAGITSACTLLFFGITPWPIVDAAPGIVDFSPLEIVRTESSGFVEEVLVHDGQLVKKGDELARLRNDELSLELVKLEIEIKKSQQKMRRLRNQQEMAKYKAEESQLESWEKQRTERERQLHALNVVAPMDGRVIRRQLESLEGVYLKEGDVLLSIGREQAKELRVSLSQEDVEDMASLTSKTSLAKFACADSLPCRIERVIPRATLSAPHESMYSVHGGSLPVRRRDSDSDSVAAGEFELLVPRFQAVVPLSESQSSKLMAGQRCQVLLDGRQPSIGEHLWHEISMAIENAVNPPQS